MARRKHGSFPSILVAAILCVGCDATAPSTTVTDSFSGTLQPRSSTWHNFVVSSNGAVQVVLASLPSSVPSVGVGIGLAQNGCSRLTWSDQVAVSGGVALDADVGTYCVLIYDSGGVSTAAAYTLSVTHP